MFAAAKRWLRLKTSNRLNLGDHSMLTRLAVTALFGIFAFTVSQPALAADDVIKPARILMVTQSAGFKHGSVSRPDGKLAPAEQAVTELGISSNLFRVDCTQDCAADF